MKNKRRRLTVEELASAEHFHVAGLLLMPRCAVCGERSTEVHHVVDAQQLRSMNATRAANVRRGINTLLPQIDVYDLANGLGLCELCHVRHTRAISRVPRRNLRPANLAFARKHHLTWFIDRFYPGPEEAPRAVIV